MNRKKFLLSSLSILTLPMFLEKCSSHYPRIKGNRTNNPLEDDKITEPILKSIQVGITAPNPHNTQAWKFQIISSTEMNLYIDEKRILPITDPTTRQIHIGQGCFLEFLSIGANKIGYESEIKLFPEGESNEIGTKILANVKLKPSKKDSPLYEAISKRATNRDYYIGEKISEQEFENLKILGQAKNSELKFISNQIEIHSLNEIFYEATKIETLTRYINEENRIWFRFGDDEIQKHRDGISLKGQNMPEFQRFMAETFFIGKEPEKFHNPDGNKIYLNSFKEKMNTNKGLIYWKTKTNSKKDWILTGMDFARFQLSCTKENLVIQPLSQVLQEYKEMNEVRDKFEKLTSSNSDKNKIQMIVRIGRANSNFITPRISIQEKMI